jgi:hypothetical protein
MGEQPIMRAVIDYGYGVANFWGRFPAETVENIFMEHASQCFGIRKSIAGFRLASIEPASFPKVFGVDPEQIALVLDHSGDRIVWNDADNKIKSEWDR